MGFLSCAIDPKLRRICLLINPSSQMFSSQFSFSSTSLLELYNLLVTFITFYVSAAFCRYSSNTRYNNLSYLAHSISNSWSCNSSKVRRKSSSATVNYCTSRLSGKRTAHALSYRVFRFEVFLSRWTQMVFSQYCPETSLSCGPVKLFV